MNWRYTFLSIIINIAILKRTSGDCKYQSRYSCYDHEAQGNESKAVYNSNSNTCSLKNILDHANYTLIASQDGSLSTGIIKVNINLPSIDCEYHVALLVNNNITNEEGCRQHEFENESDKELHSTERSICVSRQDAIDQIGYDGEKCMSNNVALYFLHIYTACYALRYTINRFNYAIRSRKYIETDYKRVEFEEPKFQCTYDDRNDVDDSTNLVTFNFVMSIVSDSSSLTLRLIALPYSHENEDDVCSQHNGATKCAWEISNRKLRHLAGTSTPDGSCSSIRSTLPKILHSTLVRGCQLDIVRVENGTDTKDIECSFTLPVPYNDSYCFSIQSDDERCRRNSVWNPPPRNSSDRPCSWMSKCTRYQKAIQTTDYNGPLQETKIRSAITSLLFPIVIGLICFILIIFGILTWIYRMRAQRSVQQAYLNANLRDLQVMKNVVEEDGINDTDEDNEKMGKLLDDRAIVLLYAKGPKSFMGFMSEFREILKLYCSCHIHDWYAACEWDAVARVGPCDWAAQLFKKNYRTVWIDTPNARSLITSQVMNNIIPTNDGQSSLDSISDFRDVAFPAVLDGAKRSIVNTKLQYSKHFIVRLEGYDNANSTEDPFADLSPHARYLIPYHLSQLCSHLSSKKSDNFGQTLMTEETKLRERLIQMKNDS